MTEIAIGKVVWMVEDLATTVARDGTPLVLADTDAAWRDADAARKPAYRPAPRAGVGHLYNMHALSVIAPEGWNVAGTVAWSALEETCSAEPSLGKSLGFRERVGLAYFGGSSRADERDAAYWNRDASSDESWGTTLRGLPVQHFVDCNRWGVRCDYGLFVRCVREVT